MEIYNRSATDCPYIDKTDIFDLLRQHAQHIFHAGVQAADPYLAVKTSLDTRFFENHQKIFLLAMGKAACAMAKAAQELIPDNQLIAPGIAITNHENVATIERVDVYGAAHPVPDESGSRAAQQIIQRLAQAKSNELVLAMISGGASALVPCPAGDISLQEKMLITQLLLNSGASIHQTNCVRKHLSLIKGGGLARIAFPARLHALILSDVIGDDVSVIASGPTVADSSTYSDAVQFLKSKQIWSQTPVSVRQHLERGVSGDIPETPKPGDEIFNRTSYDLVGSNVLSVDAMQQTAKDLGYKIIRHSDAVCGEARDVAEAWAMHAKTLAPEIPTAVLAGGETTVTVRGAGLGGRNQELALAFAIAAAKYSLNFDWVLLSAGTDGIDGPTNAAGGLIDKHSLQRMIRSGIDPERSLANNDSSPALTASGDLLITGATGTNVADLQVLLIRPR